MSEQQSREADVLESIDGSCAEIAAALRASTRERTAATILAAMVQAQAIVDSDVLVDDADTLAPGAVRLADALRAELAKGKP